MQPQPRCLPAALERALGDAEDGGGLGLRQTLIPDQVHRFTFLVGQSGDLLVKGRPHFEAARLATRRRRGRGQGLLGALVAVAACASDKDRAAAEAKPDYLASFAPEAADLLLIEVRDEDPVLAARLVAPDGTATEAHAIDTERHATGGGGGGFYPSVGVGVGGGSNSGVSTGVGIGFPIFGGGGGGGRLEYESVARIRTEKYAHPSWNEKR